MLLRFSTVGKRGHDGQTETLRRKILSLAGTSIYTPVSKPAV
jgi:hypothetical protein